MAAGGPTRGVRSRAAARAAWATDAAVASRCRAAPRHRQAHGHHRARRARPDRRARGRDARRALRHPHRRARRWSATSTWAACRTCCPAWRRRSSTSAGAATACCTPARSTIAEDLEGPPPRIEQVLKTGQAVMVQVTKDPIGGKGARLTAQIRLPGRFLVFAPNSEVVRHQPPAPRRRAPAPQGDPEEGPARAARRDRPHRRRGRHRGGPRAPTSSGWSRSGTQIEKSAKKAKAPAVLYEEPELTVRVVRDLFTDEEFREIVTDSPRVYDQVMDYLRDVAPDLRRRRSACTRARCRRSRSTTSSSRSTRRWTARCGCPRAATSSSTAPRP